MIAETIRQKVTEVIADQLGLETASVPGEMPLDDPSWKELELWMVVVKLEVEFDIELDDRIVAAAKTVSQLIDAVVVECDKK